MLLKGIQYIGQKERKVDNVAATGLVWTRGQIHAVPAALAPKFENHPDVWAVVDVTDENVINIGHVIDIPGTTPAEVEQNFTTEVLQQIADVENSVKADAKEKVDDLAAVETAILTEATLPQSFDGMTKADIAAFVKSNYGLDVDHRTMTKEALVDVVRSTHNARSRNV